MISAKQPICDLRLLPVTELPFSHVRHESFLTEAALAALQESFPTCPPYGGTTGYSLYSHDDEYQRLLAEHAVWQDLYDSFHSQSFLNWAIEQFADVWERDGCTIDLSKAVYVPYHEDRIDKERRALRRVEHAPHELWVRMDIYQGHVGYRRPVHLDHARRVVSMLIYLSDRDAAHMQGGELLLHGPRWRRWTQPPVCTPPRANLMVAFPCSKRSYHSVTRIKSLASPRNYLQVHLSSSVDAWRRPLF